MRLPAFIIVMGFITGGLFAQVATPHTPRLEPVTPIVPAKTVEMNTNRIPLRLGLMFISGAADGMSQVVAFHPDRFFEMHPNANRRFWDNRVSWRNKYRNGDPDQGRAFIGSTTWLAWTTDAYHLTRTTSRITAVAGLTIPLWQGSGKKLRHYAAEVALSGLAWSGGFHATYSLLYRE